MNPILADPLVWVLVALTLFMLAADWRNFRL